MKTTILILIFFSLLSCKAVVKEPGQASPPETGPTKPLEIQKAAWENRWEDTIKNGQKEGKVVIYSALTPVEREGLSEGFKKRYGLTIEWVPGVAAQVVEKLYRERRSNLFYADLISVGTSYNIRQFKPEGLLDRMDVELLLPEVLDESKWEGNSFPWVDKEHLVIAPALSPTIPVVINTTLVQADEIKSYKDLLKPRFKGNMVMFTPGIPGASQSMMIAIGEKIMGWDYIRELVKQDITLFSDNRQVVEWVARGKALMVLVPQTGALMDFLDAGAPLSVITPAEGSFQTSGNQTPALIKDRPHPNATRLFINWYLSREGMSIVARTGLRYSRLDLPEEIMAGLARIKRPSGTKYFSRENEEYIRETELKGQKVIVEIFAPLLK